MERLTELKLGQELNVDVLQAWVKVCGSGNWATGGDISSKELIRQIMVIEPTKFQISFPGFTNTNIKREGFIEFYNQFYKLDTQPVKSKVEDWYSCVFYCNSRDEYNEIKNRLIAIGFNHNKTYDSAIYIRTETSGNYTSQGSIRDGWRSWLVNPRQFEYKEAIAVLSNSSKPMEILSEVRSRLDLIDLVNAEFYLPNKEEQDKLLTKLFEFGYTLNSKAELWFEYIPHWSVNTSAMSISGNNCSWNYTKVDYSLLLNQQLINKNNIYLTNSRNGSEIHVQRKIGKVTRGQRPTGITVSGRRCRATIGIGYLSNKASNC